MIGCSRVVTNVENFFEVRISHVVISKSTTGLAVLLLGGQYNLVYRTIAELKTSR